MTKELLETNIEPLNDYQDYRQENDDAALVDNFMSEFEGKAEIEEEPQDIQVKMPDTSTEIPRTFNR
jgi:hypothetical protein